MDAITDGTYATHFMKLYLSLIDELTNRKLEPKDAADMALGFINNFYMYSANKDMPAIKAKNPSAWIWEKK